jgi:hypothetical protein
VLPELSVRPVPAVSAFARVAVTAFANDTFCEASIVIAVAGDAPVCICSVLLPSAVDAIPVAFAVIKFAI